MYSGVGEGGQGGGGQLPPPPPLFGHVCTLNERKVSSYSMSATYVEQLNQNFCLRLHQKLSQSTKTPKQILGGGGGACPQTPLNRSQKCCPPHFHYLPTLLMYNACIAYPIAIVAASHCTYIAVEPRILNWLHSVLYY